MMFCSLILNQYILFNSLCSVDPSIRWNNKLPERLKDFPTVWTHVAVSLFQSALIILSRLQLYLSSWDRAICSLSLWEVMTRLCSHQALILLYGTPRAFDLSWLSLWGLLQTQKRLQEGRSQTTMKTEKHFNVKQEEEYNEKSRLNLNSTYPICFLLHRNLHHLNAPVCCFTWSHTAQPSGHPSSIWCTVWMFVTPYSSCFSYQTQTRTFKLVENRGVVLLTRIHTVHLNGNKSSV